MASEIFIPHLAIANSVATSRMEMDYAYFSSVCPSVPESLDYESTRESLKFFSREMSGQKLSEYMQAYRKRYTEETDFDFRIKPTAGNSYDDDDSDDNLGYFYNDAQRGMVMGVQNQAQKFLPLGIVCFSMGRELDNYHRGIAAGRMNFSYQFPVINQVQGPSTNGMYIGDGDKTSNQRYKEAVEIIKKYKWERALIGLVLKWARSEEIPAVYLLPALLNGWSRPYREKNLYLRYNVSAERSGFTRQPNGLYGISLL
jgi:hypothetical protein